MLKSKFSSQRLFFPFTCLLGLIVSAAELSNQLGLMTQVSSRLNNIDIFNLDQALQLTSIAIFAVLIVLLRNVEFKIIFKTTVVFSALALLIGTYLFPNSLITYFLASFFCSKALALLGWAYINQMAKKNEGIKYYFALSFAAGIITAFITNGMNFFFIELINREIQTVYSPLFAWTGIICLGLVWVCDRVIRKRMDENEVAENTLVAQSEWLTVICLGIIACGFKVIYKLTQPEFKAQAKKLFVTGQEYCSFMETYCLVLGCAMLCFSALSIFIGPKIVEKKGWKYAALIAPLAMFIAIVLSTAKITTWTFPMVQVMTQIFNQAWIFLLVQITFLSYAKKTRFSLQAWTFLVVAALIEFAFAFANLGHTAASIASYVILALMVASTYILSKPNNSMELPQ
jgi:ATP/ADP translocase